MAVASINGAHIYYEAQRVGAPLLLVAGLASDSQRWRSVVAELSRHRRVITLDNRGAGRTRAPDQSISINSIADDCAGLIEHLGLSCADLLGHSMGGFVAQECALRHPGCVGKLILIGTAARNPQRNNRLFSDWVAYRRSGMDMRLWFRNLFYWIH